MTNQELHNFKQIAVYARVSSSNQENEGTIETQLSAIYEYANNKNYHIVKEYLDNGWSGDNIIRPELDNLRVDAKKSIWEAVLIYDPDRLARRYSYQELITDELREAGIEVIFVTTPAPANGLEKILFGVQGLFAEYERAKITERFRLGKVRKANEGHVIASEAPYGYSFIPKQGKRGEDDFKQGYFEINRYEAEVVKAIFKWSAEGITIRGIVKKLQDLVILPRKSKRGVWNTSTLSTLLRNKTYIGEAHYGASYAVIPVNPIKKEIYKKVRKSSRRSKPENEWIKIQVPSIIDEKLFLSVQERLKLNFELSKRNTKNEYLLSGKIWCICGSRRVGEGALKGKHLYYRCTGRINCYPLPPSCHQKGINAKIADLLTWNIISNMMTNPRLMKEQAGRWLKNKQPEVENSGTSLELLNSEIGKLKEQEERYTRAFGEGLFPIEQLRDYLDPIRERVSLLSKQLMIEESKARKPVIYKTPNEQDIEAFAKRATEVIANFDFDLKKNLLKDIIDKVVCEDKRLLVKGHIPSEYLENVAFITNYRNGVNTTPLSESTNGIHFSFNIDLDSGKNNNKV